MRVASLSRRVTRSVASLLVLTVVAACDEVGTPMLNSMADRAVGRGEYAAALRYADVAVLLAPKRWEGYARQAMALTRLGRNFEALKQARIAARLGNGRPAASYMLAEPLYRTGQFDALIALLDGESPDPSSEFLDYLRAMAPIAAELARFDDAPFEHLARRAIAGADRCRVLDTPTVEEQDTWRIECVSFVPGCTPRQLVERSEPFLADNCTAYDKGARCELTWEEPLRSYRWTADYSNGARMEFHYLSGGEGSREVSVISIIGADRWPATIRGFSTYRDGGVLDHAVVEGRTPDIGWLLQGNAETFNRGREWFAAHPCPPA